MKRTFLSIILVNIMLFFALVSIHEISHVIIGYCLDCEYQKAILFDNSFNGPHTELICNNKINEFFVYMGGLVITTIFSLSFLLVNTNEKNMSFLSLGISIILGSLDVSLALNSQTIFYPLLTVGLFFITLGEYFLTSFYIEEDFSFRFLKNRKFLEEEI